MDTKVIKPSSGIAIGAELIKQGEVVAFPTETVYGLGGNALSESAVSKIFIAKGRPADNPLIVHIADFDDIYPLAKEVSDRNLRVAKAFMPGAITLLFPRSDIVPSVVTAGLSTVGIRMPNHDVAREFIRACGLPIAAPSANMSTRISPTEAAHVYEDLQGRIPLIIDGGSCDVGIESTVLDLSGDIPVILRPGAITADMISAVIGGEVRSHTGEVIAQAPAPGMKYKHYAPICDMVVAGDINTLNDTIAEYQLQGKRVIAIIRDEDIPHITNHDYISLGACDDDWLRNIYSSMRVAEKRCDAIVCIDLATTSKGKSIMNRVNKAAKRI